MDELTNAMHSEFSISKEMDRKHIIFSALYCIYELGYAKEEASEEYGVTLEEIERYQTEYEEMIEG